MISASEFKAKCLALLDDVDQTGCELVISKHGRPVAKLVPVGGARPWKKLIGTGAYTGDPFHPAVEERDLEVFQ